MVTSEAILRRIFSVENIPAKDDVDAGIKPASMIER